MTIIAFLALSTLGFSQSHTVSLIVNADSIRRENAKAQMMVYLEAREIYKSIDKDRYQEVSKKYRAARALYRKYARLAVITEDKLDDFRLKNPELYQEINQLRTEDGRQVSAFVGSKVSFSTHECLGFTAIHYLPPKGSGFPTLSLKSEVERGIVLLHPQHHAIKISLSVESTLTDTRHEFGHFMYAVSASRSYFSYLSGLVAKGVHHCHDGHLHGDPSGYFAKAIEHHK